MHCKPQFETCLRHVGAGGGSGGGDGDDGVVLVYPYIEGTVFWGWFLLDSLP